MTPGPEPGSAWERRCPDAWPIELLHLSAGLMPPGKRLATPQEAALIAGRLTEADYLATASSRATASPPATRGQKTNGKGQSRKPHRVVGKLRAANTFLDSLITVEPRLPPLAVSVWLWMWRCERNGVAVVSVAKLAARFDVDRRTVRRALDRLRKQELVVRERRGQAGAGASVYRLLAPKLVEQNPGE